MNLNCNLQGSMKETEQSNRAQYKKKGNHWATCLKRTR
jgi:hypothetical protein